MSRPNSNTANFAQFQNLIREKFGITWRKRLVRPAETRWMVIWEGAALLTDRWDEVYWVFTEWAPSRLFSGQFKQYWIQGAFMMQDPFFRLQAEFAKSLGEKILN